MFTLSRADASGLPGRARPTPRMLSANSLMPALTPLFGGPDFAQGLKLPQKLQPSPWHVIFRSLDPAVDKSMADALLFDGLAMDTF
jgi:hypothetical protein